MHLVLIETAGNQRYIFATNKLRENVGASELTYRVGTQWVLEADDRLRSLWDDSAAQFRKNLLNQPHLEDSSNSIEVIVATSGKVMLLVNEREVGKRIVEAVTERALRDAPGLDVCGFVSDSFALNETPLGDAVRQAHETLDRLRENRPGAALRFLRLPVVMECATSGLPAAAWEKPGTAEPETALSTVTLKKGKTVKAYSDRMENLLRAHQIPTKFSANIGVLDKYCDWLAVVHADGNGVGQVFRDLCRNLGRQTSDIDGEPFGESNRKFIDSYRRFSIALEVCTEAAFTAALKNLQAQTAQLRSLKRMKEHQDDIVPILPIVLGGDDLTLVCDAQIALQFTHDFLTAFEAQTENLDSLGAPRLSACAGIAIVKPHFPFSAAYELAEQLLRSAKSTKQFCQDDAGLTHPCSALDFHVLYDSSGGNLDRIRERLLINDDTLIHARPYVLGFQDRPGLANPNWFKQHDWQELENRIKAIFATDEDGKRKLPSSQLHDLRAGLFLGHQNANARYCLIRSRYEDMGIKVFDEAGSNESLFFEETSTQQVDNKSVCRTRLLDVLDAANFWVEEPKEPKRRKQVE